MKRSITLVLVLAALMIGFLLGNDEANAASPPPRGTIVCATINNVTNVAMWKDASGKVFRATYEDRGGDQLIYSRKVPRAVYLAEAKLQFGEVGPKIARACAAPVHLRDNPNGPGSFCGCFGPVDIDTNPEDGITND